jgi:hypothetical protein
MKSWLPQDYKLLYLEVSDLQKVVTCKKAQGLKHFLFDLRKYYFSPLRGAFT